MTRTRFLLGVVFLVVVLLAFAGPWVMAAPPRPTTYYGTIRINGAAAPSWVSIEAQIGGFTCAATTVQILGVESVYAIDVPGDVPERAGKQGGIEGETIQFLAGGLACAPTGVWNEGAYRNLNLSASGSLPTATPTNTVDPSKTPTRTLTPTITRTPTQTPLVTSTPVVVDLGTDPRVVDPQAVEYFLILRGQFRAMLKGFDCLVKPSQAVKCQSLIEVPIAVIGIDLDSRLQFLQGVLPTSVVVGIVCLFDQAFRIRPAASKIIFIFTFVHNSSHNK